MLSIPIVSETFHLGRPFTILSTYPAPLPYRPSREVVQLLRPCLRGYPDRAVPSAAVEDRILFAQGGTTGVPCDVIL